MLPPNGLVSGKDVNDGKALMRRHGSCGDERFPSLPLADRGNGLRNLLSLRPGEHAMPSVRITEDNPARGTLHRTRVAASHSGQDGIGP